MTSSNLKQWNDFIDGCIDFRPNDGVFRIARNMFTEPELFDLKWNLFLKRFGFMHVTKVRFQTIMISNRSNWPSADYCEP